MSLVHKNQNNTAGRSVKAKLEPLYNFIYRVIVCIYSKLIRLKYNLEITQNNQIYLSKFNQIIQLKTSPLTFLI